jgi:hypothetical protein
MQPLKVSILFPAILQPPSPGDCSAVDIRVYLHSFFKTGRHFALRGKPSHITSIGGLLSFFTRVIPAVEVIIALLLLVPKLCWWGLAASLILLLLFTGYNAGMMLWAPELPCSCGGIVQQLSWRQHLGLNLILAGLTLWSLLSNKRTIAINRESRKPEPRVGKDFSTKNF